MYENGPFFVNSYLIVNKVNNKALIIDPGSEVLPLFQKVEKEKLNVEAVLCTHGHLDHVVGVNGIQKRLNIPFYMNQKDAFLLDSIPTQARMFGVMEPEKPKIDYNLEEDSEITIADINIKLLYTPGHSPGSISFLIDDSVISGDTLFNFSIGRSDLGGGNHELLLKSIREKIFTLPDKTHVFPGHGPETTVAKEKEFNPFFMM
ncbi:MAG: MBL fold metallo-hydrolase [Spirochaetota bacterium]|nr:MBL fold metallo-hydrolase [Spirochaetota bacterium]